MYREVAAYRTLEHQRIPKLVDSNVDSFRDPGFRLLGNRTHPGGDVESVYGSERTHRCRDVHDYDFRNPRGRPILS
jgi:hypothetical protein